MFAATVAAVLVVAAPAGATTESAKLTASDAAGNDQFGISVAISGNAAIVGARDDDDAGSSRIQVGGV